MKNIFLFLFSFILIGHVAAQEPAKMFKVKSGHIEYKLTGNTVGTKTLWWDDYGYKQNELIKSTTTVKVFGIENVEHTNTQKFQRGDDFWTINYLDETSYHSRVSGAQQMGQSVENNYTDSEQKEMSEDFLNGMGGNIEGTEKFLGRSCEIMNIMGSKSWIYKGIALKSESNVMGISTNETAISFEENIAIPASRFQQPKGDYEDMSQNLGGLYGYEEEYDDSDDINIPPPSISLDKFCSAVKALPSSVYTVSSCMEMDNTYISMVTLKTGGMFAISASHESAYELGVKAGEMPEGMTELSVNGHKALYASKIWDEEEQEFMELPMLIVFFPSKNTNLVIAGG